MRLTGNRTSSRSWEKVEIRIRPEAHLCASSAAYALGVRESSRRRVYCRQSRSYPETEFGEISGDVLEADFWPIWLWGGSTSEWPVTR